MVHDALDRTDNRIIKLQMIVLHIEVENGVGTKLRPENELIGSLTSSQDIAVPADQHISERTEAWLKIKAVQRGKFPVVGFIKDPAGVAALYLGKQEGKELVYMGKVVPAGAGSPQARSARRSIPL